MFNLFLYFKDQPNFVIVKRQLLVLFLSIFSFYGFSQVDLGEDITACEGSTVILDATTTGASTYLWYFEGFPIAGETNATLSVHTSGEYIVQVFISSQIIYQDEILVTFIPGPPVANPTDLVVCDPDGDGYASVDLTVKSDEIANGIAGLSITYHETQADAEADVNALVTPYTNITNPQTIYARAEGIDCYSVVSFTLIVDASCGDTQVICGPTPLVITECYSSGYEWQYNFISNEGSPLTVTFTSGQLDVNTERVIIYDSDGSIELYNGTNNGDLNGLTVVSTGDRISVRIEAYSTSCEAGDVPPIGFEVSCSEFVGAITGAAFYDENSDDVFDDEEFRFRNGYYTYEVNNDGVIHEINSSSGKYYISVSDVNDVYEIAYNIYGDYEDCYNVESSVISGVTASLGETVEVNFPVDNNLMCGDVGVYLVSLGTPRPGFSREVRMLFKNFGSNVVTSGTITFEHDDLFEFNGVTGLSSFSYNVTTTPTGFTLDFVNLEPGNLEYVEFSLLCPADVALGEMVTHTATYTTADNDDFEANNTSSLSQTVIGSYDPNDIMEAHGPEIIHNDFTTSDEYLYYTIRFQNVGTAEAIFVRIENMLDGQLDETTFQMLHASHNYVMSRVGSDLQWQFDNIYLPAEQDDAAGSNGYVYYRIKPKPGYAIGDIIPNTAAIYFDFNEPIITNTFETEFVEENLSLAEASLQTFDLSPNPASDIINIDFGQVMNQTISVSVYNVLGKRVLSTTLSDVSERQIDVSALKNGLYFVRLRNSKSEIVRKLIIK